MEEPATQSVDILRSHAERGNEGPRVQRGAFWPLFLLLIFAAGTLIALQVRRPKPPNPFAGQPLPPLEVAGWLNTDRPLTTDELRGKVVLVDFWATSCGPCLRHMPELVDFYTRFRDQGVTIVGLTHEPEALVDRVKHVAETVKMAWPIGYGAGFVFDRMGIYGTPTYVLYDRTGRSVWGGHSLNGLEDATVAALARK